VDVTPCSFVRRYEGFGGTCCHHVESRRVRREEKISGGIGERGLQAVEVSWPVNRKCCLLGTLFVQRVPSGVGRTFHTLRISNSMQQSTT